MSVDIKSFAPEIFRLFNERWGLVTAGTLEDFNTMTISWGSLGTIWGNPAPSQGWDIVTVYVNPARYTWGYMNKNDYFTVSFYPPEFKKELAVLGSQSGRDGDKVALTKLTPKAVEHGVTFEEAQFSFTCKKIYSHAFKKEEMAEEVAVPFYSAVEPHWMYIGRIVEAAEK